MVRRNIHGLLGLRDRAPQLHAPISDAFRALPAGAKSKPSIVFCAREGLFTMVAQMMTSHFFGWSSASRRFEFQKRRQLFIGLENAALSVVPMCVCNPDRSPARINR